MVLTLGTFFSTPAVSSPYKINKTVTPMENGNFLVKIIITSSGKDIFGVKLIDSDESILDVYAPKGWCVVTDGGSYAARTSGNPIKKSKSIELIIHTSLEDISFTYSIFGLIEQMGLPNTI
jgi:hypothetical protein